MTIAQTQARFWRVLAGAFLWLCVSVRADAAPGYVVNFDVPGGVSGAINYAGQGAYPDPLHNYWNAFVFNGVTTGALCSDGVTPSGITLADNSKFTYGTQGPQGTSAGLEAPFAGEKTGVIVTNKVENIPSGTYDLILYGNNGGYNNRGATFTVSAGGTFYGAQSTVNNEASTFTPGNDYVEFTNVVVGSGGEIIFTYTANTAATNFINPQNEGDFNGLQLIAVSTAQITNMPAAAITANTAMLAANVLSAGGSIPAVTIFYGTSDGGTNTGNWANSVNLGSLVGTGLQPVINLSSNTTYYFAARASNNTGVSWASPSSSFTTLATNQVLVYGPMTQPICLTNDWQLQSISIVTNSGGFISDTNYEPAGWYPATVPGTVLTTLVNDGVYPEPLYGTNNYNIPDSLCRTSYWYRSAFVIPPDGYSSNRLWLNFDGINYTASVWLNGTHLGSIQGAFARGRFDITDCANVGGTNALAVLVSPEPNPGTAHQKTIAGGTGHNGGVTATDGPTFLCTVGWDWIPTIRDRATGIWQGVSVSGTGPVVIQNPYVTTSLPLPATNMASVNVQVTLSNATTSVQSGIFTGTIGAINFSQMVSLNPLSSVTLAFNPVTTPSLLITNPALWWPNGYGQPNLYNLQLAFAVSNVLSDTQSLNFGIRQIAYTQPGSTNLGLVVNGVNIVAKGGDWGMDEAMKRIPASRLDAEVHMHQQANYDIIRNWVGQSTSEAFYDACDKYGILVWDEFFQPNPGDGPNVTNVPLYLVNVQEKLLRFRNHPCIALWCGRNEGNPAPTAVAQGISNLVSTLDPGRFYQPNSSAGMGVKSSGPYYWRAPRIFYLVDAAFKTEIGSVSIPTLEAVENMMPSADWQIINDDWAEHDFCSGAQQGNLYPSLIANRYGAFANLADFVRKGQLANYEAFRAMYEGRFAQLFKPVTGVITWMSNPAQPSFVWQLYSWDLEPNASLFAVRKACEPVHVMMNQTNWHLMVVNNEPQTLNLLSVRTREFNLDGSLQYAATNMFTAPGSAVTDLGLMTFPASLSAVHFVKLELFDATSNLLSDNFYWRETNQDDFQALNTLSNAIVNVQANWQTIGSNVLISVTLSNQAPVVALMTHLQLRQAVSGNRVLPVFYSDNYISLIPGETKSITIQAGTNSLNGEAPLLAVDGWNVNANTVVGSGNTVAVVLNQDATITQMASLSATNVLRINAGGSAGYIPFGNSDWGADLDYNGGSTTTTITNVDTSTPNAAPAWVYETERWGPMTYTIPVSPQYLYLVRLHFAEVKFGPGQRQFNLAINGQQVLTNFDIAAAGGEDTAVVRDFAARPDVNTNIVLSFTVGAADQPKVCGIEIVPISPVLNMSTASHGGFTLNWPAWPNYTLSLCTATNLTPPVAWALATNDVIYLNGTNMAQVSVGADSKFFQLRGP